MSLRLLPEGTPREAILLFWGRGLRAFGDGFISLLLPVYLSYLGFDALEIGVLIGATLLGSAAATLGVGLYAHRFGRCRLLVIAALIMTATGACFLLETRFWPLVLVGFVGTLNPSTGDVSLFLPLEQALLAQVAPDRARTSIFAAYSLIAALVGAVGALAAGVPQLLEAVLGASRLIALQSMFAVYMVLGLVTYHLYRRLPPALDARPEKPPPPLGPSRRIVFVMAGLFSLDAFGGGLGVQSLVALWLFQRFGLSEVAAGSIFFWAGLLAAASFPTAVWLARRIGLVNTMVFTHLPSNFCWIALPFAPDLATAIALLLVRSALSQMDVPTRTSYVMAVVTPPERAAAASITALPRSLAAAAGPLVTGWLLELSPFGWFLVAGGTIKSIYDLLLLALFRRRPPPEEAK